MSQIANLRSRLNRRLIKLAKWADSSQEDRHSEFRNNPNHNYPYRSLIKPMLYSKPISVTEINVMKSVKIPSHYTADSKSEIRVDRPAENVSEVVKAQE